MASKKDKKINTFGLKMISIGIAFIIWIGVYNLADGITPDTKKVKINTRNEDIMEDMKLDYSLNGNDSVKIRYKVRSNERGKISSNDFNVYIDFSEYTVTEAFPLHCDILNNKDSLIYDISLEPSIIKVSTEQIQNKTFHIEYILNGAAKDSYRISNIDLSDYEVEIEGPQSELGRINKVGIEIDTNDIQEDKSGRQKLIYFDSNNNILKLSNKMKANIDNVQYSIHVLHSKNVDTNVNIIGEPIENVYYKSHEIVPRDIIIEGDIETINNIESIDLGTVDITGKTGDYTYNINVKDYLPEGVDVIGNNEVEVKVYFLKIEPETIVETTENIEGTNESDINTEDQIESEENNENETVESSEDIETVDVQYD